MDPPASLSNVKHIILVLSGKGGVGKSSVTTQTVLTLVNKGYNVGVLDIDLTGPSLPRMFGVESKQVHQSSKGWIPVAVNVRERKEDGSHEESRDQSDDLQSHDNKTPVNDVSLGNSNNFSSSSTRGNLLLMSLGFLLGDRGNSVVWRGPKKTAMIRQFLKDVYWGDEPLDYLVIDTPPGTSDEHIAIAEELRYAGPIDGAIIVTTPQQVAVADVKKEINFCRKVNFNVLGVVENMSGFICPSCSECTNIFSSGGGLALSQSLDLDFLGNIPIDPRFVEMVETQTSENRLLDMYDDCELKQIMEGIVDKVLAKKLPSRW